MTSSKLLPLLFLIATLGCTSNKKEINPIQIYNLRDKDVFGNHIGETSIENSKNTRIVFPKISDKVLKSSLRLSEIADTISFIKLETTDSCLFGDVDKLMCCEDGIFILDTRKSRSLLQFDFEGNFVRQVGKFGRGPAEYLKPYDFTINESESEISIFDIRQNKILTFNLKNGNFKKETTLGFYALNFEALDSTYLFNLAYKPNLHLGGIKNHMLLWTNKKGKIYNAGLAYDDFESDFLSHYVQQTNFFRYDGILNIRPSYTDTIFQVHGNDLNIRYIIENPSRIPREKYFGITTDVFLKTFFNVNSLYDYVVPYGDVFETDLYLILCERYKSYFIYYLYNKQDNTKSVFTSIDDDRFGKLASFFLPKAIYKDNLITCISPASFSGEQNILDSLNLNQIPAKIRNDIFETDLYDNPCLLFLHLKD